MRVDTRIDKKSTFRYIRSIDFITDRENIVIPGLDKFEFLSKFIRFAHFL